MEIESKMLQAIKDILAANPKCALVGGNSFLVQKKKIRRQPKDIDIYCPDGVFNLIPGMSMPKTEAVVKDDDGYEDEDNNSIDTRKSFLYEGFKVDVFTPVDPESKQKIIKSDGIKCCRIEDTIRAKINYFESGGKSKGKHRLDIMYYLMMN